MEAEQMLIAAAMRGMDKEEPILRTMGPREFTRTSHRVIWETICKMWADGVPVDALTLRTELDRARKAEQRTGPVIVPPVPDLPSAALKR